MAAVTVKRRVPRSRICNKCCGTGSTIVAADVGAGVVAATCQVFCNNWSIAANVDVDIVVDVVDSANICVAAIAGHIAMCNVLGVRTGDR